MLLRIDRQTKGEPRAAHWPVLCGCGSAVAPSDDIDNRQTEAGPACRARTAGVAPPEAVECMLEGLGIEPGTGILHRHDRIAPACRQSQSHAGPLGRVNDRVAHEVVKSLPEPVLVGRDDDIVCYVHIYGPMRISCSRVLGSTR